MTQIVQSKVKNRLLESMSEVDFNAIAPDLRPIALPFGHTVEEAGRPVEYVVFVEQGIGSRMVVGNDEAQTEGGSIGKEGMTGRSVVLEGAVASEKVLMQIGGDGLRMKSDLLLEAMSESDSLRKQMLRYVQSSQIQSDHTLLAATSNSITERVARWILMYQDRIDGDDISVTHELLATMMNVRRAGVTSAIHVLEGEHAILATRGHIHVSDRAGLIELAGGSYGIPEREYEKLIPPIASTDGNVRTVA